MVPILKNKGDTLSCENYKGIKLISHTILLWERVVKARLRSEESICEWRYGFKPRKSITEALFAFRMLLENYRKGQSCFVYF